MYPTKYYCPQVDRKSIRKGRISPPEGKSNSSHELYNVPRSVYDNASQPQSGGDTFHQESTEGATFTISPTETENVYNIPKSMGGSESDFYSTPRPQNQPSNDEVDTGYTGGTVIYNIPPARQMVKPPDDGYDLYNTPKPAVMNGHELYNTPRSVPPANDQEGYNPTPPPADGQETYNIPRAALESHLQQVDEGLYNVPRSVEGTPSDVYSVPKPEMRSRKSYDSLELKQNGSTPHHDHQVHNNRGNSVRYHTINSRQRLPTPEQETYSVPRPSDSMPRRTDGRYPYEYVDHQLPRNPDGTLKSSRSLESLVHRRVNLSPDPPLQTRTHRTPSPRALNHRYIEIDLIDPPDGSSGQRQRPENVYAEIQDTEPIRHGSHPNTAIHSTSNPYAAVPSNLRAAAVNSSPAPHVNNGSASVSKEARALHKDGYELVLPAEEGSRNQTLKHQVSSPRGIGNGRKGPPSQSHSVQFANNGGFSSVGNGSLAQLSSSGPLNPNPSTDEYVIVTRQNSTQPRDIPVPLPQAQGGTTNVSQAINPLCTSVDNLQDDYEVMNAVKRQVHLDRIAGNGSKFQMPPPVPAKKGMSVSASQGNCTPQGEANRRQSMRDSMDLDSVESGSRVSVSSSNHLEDVVGPLSPMETSVNSPLQSVPSRKNVVKVASGSPNDITPSKDLR